jgi:RNA 2',3'-cyclic 3'-phosphodiesterase
MTNLRRLFFATHIQPLPILESFFAQIKQDFHFDNISWAKPEQMHITLRFFGETPQSRIPHICNALKKALHKEQLFSIQLRQLKMFGSRYHPQVLWLGVDDKGPLKNLFAKTQSSLSDAGFEGDRQNFVPHLTLGRLKKIDNLPHFQSVLDRYSDVFAGEYTIDEFVLYESLLRPQGALHIPVEKFLLNTY